MELLLNFKNEGPTIATEVESQKSIWIRISISNKTAISKVNGTMISKIDRATVSIPRATTAKKSVELQSESFSFKLDGRI